MTEREARARRLPIAAWVFALAAFATWDAVADSNPGTPDSPTVGMSGAATLRLALVMPSARMRLPLTWVSKEGAEPNITSMRPPIMSGTVVPLPLYGTCSMSVPV